MDDAPRPSLQLGRKERRKRPVRIVDGAFALLNVVARGGIEPPTYRFSGGRSYQLSYLAKAEVIR